MSRRVIWVVSFVAAAGLSAATAALLSEERPQPGTKVVSASMEAPAQGELGPVLRSGRDADLDLSMVISPGYAGTNDLNFYMIDVDRDWKEVERFGVRFTYLDDQGRQEFELVQLHEGHFPLEHLDLRYAGRWRAEVTVLRFEVGESRFSFDFDLPHR